MMPMGLSKKHVKRVVLEGLGWLLILVGAAALVLPGPGLLALFAGMALLATQYDWAERRLDPIRKAAFKAASDSVQTWPRIMLSVLFSLALIVLGIIWGMHPATPSWWPLADKLWLVGGWGAGGTLIGSGLIALGMIIYSFRTFRGKDKA
jgi:hypothetical protein